MVIWDRRRWSRLHVSFLERSHLVSCWLLRLSDWLLEGRSSVSLGAVMQSWIIKTLFSISFGKI